MQKQQLLFWILVLALFALIFMSCSHRMISGQITEVKEDTVQCQGVKFKIYPNVKTPLLGDTATFIRSVNRNKINCKIIKK